MKGLILTYVIAIAGTVGALRYPLFGLYIYVGFAVMRPQGIFGWAGDLSGISWWVGIATLIGWAFKGFGNWQFGRARWIVVALTAFLVWFALSSVLALNPGLAFEQWTNLSKLVLPFFVGITMMRSQKDWLPMWWIIVLSMGYVGVEMNIDYAVKGYNTASEGFAGMDNNFFGLALVTVLGPAIVLAVYSRTWPQRIAAAVAAAAILHTILLTFSRGAFLGILTIGATAFVMIPKRPRNVFGVLIFVLIALRFTGPQLAERYATIFVPAEQRDTSSESRIDLWRDCLLVIQEFPVFGVGPANWRTIAARYGWPPGKSAHSVWMESAAENGLPGALFLLLFFLIAALKLWPIARQRVTEENRFETALAAGGVLSIAGFIVTGQFVSAPSLEVPYYVVMTGIAMLRSRPQPAVAAVPARTGAPAPGFRPVAVRRPLAAGPRSLPIRRS